MSAIGSRHAHIYSLALMALVAACAIPSMASAQFDVPGVQSAVGADESPYKITAQFTAPAGGQPGRLFVTAEIGDGWHVYSITQAPGGPVRTTITVDPTADYKLGGDFKSIQAPEKHADATFNNLIVESHKATVTWYAPLEFTAGVDLEKLKVAGAIKLQACTNDNCLPPKKVTFVAALGPGVPIPPPAAAPGNATSDYAPPRSHTTIRGVVQTLPGNQAQLRFTFEPAANFHLFPRADRDPQTGSKPTLIVLTNTAGLSASRPVASAEPEQHPAKESGQTDAYYTRPVTWTIDLTAPQDAKPGTYKVAGLLGFQTCSENNCDLPQAAQFDAEIPIGKDGAGKVEFAAAKFYGLVAQAAAKDGAVIAAEPAAEATAFNPSAVVLSDRETTAQTPIWEAMLLGLVGGFILNFMPCVLPVIGLKILSFVEQSGQARSRIFFLNLWYTLGLLAVFMVLAALAVFFGLGWGQLFSFSGFNIALTAIVFTMGLSFLGVWEIPIPGFVGAGKANDLAAQEGAAGAFFKGAITTILATPCSGPFLATALAWSVVQPPHLVFALFACVGIGMASPYLLIGAVPSLIRFLPRPGAWMDTFKQFMGFVLLGTVVYFLTFVPWSLVVPTVALLFCLWGACWWLGRTPLTAELAEKARAWGQAAAFVAVAWIVIFTGLDTLSGGRIAVGSLQAVMADRFDRAVDQSIADRMVAAKAGPASPLATNHDPNELPWQPFSQQALIELTRTQHTVMVDFTADWCQTCQFLAKYRLNTAEARQAVDSNRVVTLIADWTNGSEEVTKMLETLGCKAIPVLAIFPAGRPNAPIVLREPYSTETLLKAIADAGPSKAPAAPKVTAVDAR